MGPDEFLIIDIAPHEATVHTTKTIVLPWSGQLLTVTVPAGTPDGTILRLPGLAPPEAPGGPPRDAYARVRIGPPGPFAPPPAPAGFGPVAASQPPVRRGLIIAVAASAALALVACWGIGWAVWRADDTEPVSARGPVSGAPAGESPQTSTPTPTPVTPERYQAMLGELNGSLAAGFRTLGAAKNPKAVGAAASKIESVIDDEGAALTAVTPPAEVAGAHDRLADALQDLGDSMSEAGSGSGSLCLGPAATSWVSRETAADRLRDAAKALSTADPARAYSFGSFVPKETKATNRRLGNGAYVKRPAGGSGELKIENGGSDAVISIVRKGAKKPFARVYVRGKKDFTVYGIADGTYQIFMTGGVDWDTRLKAFGRDCGFQKFDDSFKFTTSSSTYTGWTITLTPSIGGNATTSDVDPDAFPVD